MTPVNVFFILFIIFIMVNILDQVHGLGIYFCLLFAPYVTIVKEVPLSIPVIASFFMAVSIIIRERQTLKYRDLFIIRPILILLLLMFPIFLLPKSSNDTVVFFTRFFTAYFVPYFAPAFFVFVVIRTEKQLAIFTNYIFVLLIIFGVYGIFEFLNGFVNPYWDWYFSYLPATETDFGNSSRTLLLRLGILMGRVRSFVPHSIVYGGRLASLFALLMYIILIRKNITYSLRPKFPMIITVLIIVVINIFLTFSRSAWFFVVITVFLYLLYEKTLITSRQTRTLARYLILFPSILFALYLILNYFLSDELFSGSSIAGRQMQLRIVWDYVTLNSVLFGFGFGSMFEAAYITKILPQAFGFESIIFEVLFEHGVAGLAAYSVFFFGLYMSIRSFTRRFIGASVAYLALFAGYLAFVIITGERQTLFIFLLVLVVMSKYTAFYGETHEGKASQ